MKKLYYLIIAVIGLTSLNSCKISGDDLTGDPLLNGGANPSGYSGPVSLYREIDEATGNIDAEYHYDGLKMNEVVSKSEPALTKLYYTGVTVYKIDYNGHNSEGDSLIMSRQFTYNSFGKINDVAETSRVISLPVANPVIPDVKTKSLYTFSYTGNILSKITKLTGEDIAGTPFAFSGFQTFDLTYSGGNITKLIKKMGAYSGSTLGPVALQYTLDFQNYDGKISPHSTLPTTYNISEMLTNDIMAFRASANNCQRITLSGPTIPLQSFSTDWTTDAKGYGIKGFGWDYIYKPQ